MRKAVFFVLLLSSAVAFAQNAAPAARPGQTSPGTTGAGTHGDKLFTVAQMQEILARLREMQRQWAG